MNREEPNGDLPQGGQSSDGRQKTLDAIRAVIVTIYGTGIPGIAVTLAASGTYLWAIILLIIGMALPVLLWWLMTEWLRNLLRSARAAFRRAGKIIREHWVVVTALAAALVVVVVAIIVFVWPTRCGSLMEKNGECIGTTDGSKPQVFGKRFENVLREIGAENKVVSDDRKDKYATIAFMAPVTENALRDDRLLHELEGAFTAQYRANRAAARRLSLGGAPKIRLVVANPGSGERYWKHVVNQIKALRDGRHHLVAVTGMGFSQVETVRAARELNAVAIPMIGDIITADGLDRTGQIDQGGKIPMLFRMPFPIEDQFAEVAKFLRQISREWSKPLRALLVQDASVNSSQPDLYTKSLSEAFQREDFGTYFRNGGNKINVFGDRNTRPLSLQNDFTTISNNVCGADPPDLLFYAGRSKFLIDFLKLLTGRNCRRPVKVVTGSDASVLYLDSATRNALITSKHSPTSVVFVPLVHPRDIHPPQGTSRPGNSSL